MRAAAPIFIYIHHPPYNISLAIGSWCHQQKRRIKVFWLLWLSRRSYPCMKDSDELDPDGIRRLPHFVRLSQTLCENLVCLLLCKLGLPGSYVLSLSRWFCRTCFEFLSELILFFIPTFFVRPFFAIIPIRGIYRVCLIISVISFILFIK